LRIGAAPLAAGISEDLALRLGLQPVGEESVERCVALLRILILDLGQHEQFAHFADARLADFHGKLKGLRREANGPGLQLPAVEVAIEPLPRIFPAESHILSKRCSVGTLPASR